MAMTVGGGAHTFEVDIEWAKLPPGRKAPMAALTVDSQDRIYGLNRGEHPVIVFDRNGNYLYSWGEGFLFAHCIFADPHDNIWIVDRDRCQIFKFTTKGELLMTIGTRGYRSDTGADNTCFDSSSYKRVTRPGGPFNMPTGIAVDDAGNIFITDGYANCQVHRFSPEGKYLYSWGAPGDGPGQFRVPHGVWLDRRGRVLIADRQNDRVQVFSRDGQFIEQWPTQLIGPATFWVDENDTVYVPEHNGGMFSVLTLDGERLARWGSEKSHKCHGVGCDSQRNAYFVQPVAGEGSGGRRIVKYIRTG